MSKNDDSKLFAFLGVFLTIIGFIIVYAAKKDDKYALFYAKQGLVLFFGWVVVWIISMILAMIPFIGWFVSIILHIAMAILWLMGMIYAFSGEQKEIPVIGTFAKMINI